MTLKFECPHCGQHISADSDQAGSGGNCPACNQPIVVPGTPAYRPPPQRSIPPNRATQAGTSPAVIDLPSIPLSSLGGYVTSTLQQNETPLHKTTVHWIIFLRAAISAIIFSVILVPISMALASYDKISPRPIGIGVFLVLVVLLVLQPVVTYLTSEFVITDRRILIKVGFISRRSIEMFISKIESVDVSQDIFGRLFDYGTVTLRGTGGSAEPFRVIAHPIQFRNCIQRIQSHNEGR